ncbi:hypothetical protein IV498_16285 [Paenarthrobacter sp. Z7-10]|uniref:hypothetical protein n=1 Tax=Paenarthrobacter sp. Z7-10 TaxID=2787635 RepID=UPI0022A97940|nr:hypothetical protein [Paenarthrobacter sp. Z7-10]MCZ2404693.1 hypothetical protein [Paenarthrobacter sp. Z7-10]
MAPTNPPKGDRAGNDYHEGDNPAPGGKIDTGDSAVPPYAGRSEGSAERDGTARAMGSKEPLHEPPQPGSDAVQSSDDMAPEGVGESRTRRGEDIVQKDGKEAGRKDTAQNEGRSNRPAGESDDRDRTSIDPG